MTLPTVCVGDLGSDKYDAIVLVSPVAAMDGFHAKLKSALEPVLALDSAAKRKVRLESTRISPQVLYA